jgi:hypothetical protein
MSPAATLESPENRSTAAAAPATVVCTATLARPRRGELMFSSIRRMPFGADHTTNRVRSASGPGDGSSVPLVPAARAGKLPPPLPWKPKEAPTRCELPWASHVRALRLPWRDAQPLWPGSEYTSITSATSKRSGRSPARRISRDVSLVDSAPITILGRQRRRLLEPSLMPSVATRWPSRRRRLPFDPGAILTFRSPSCRRERRNSNVESALT